MDSEIAPEKKSNNKLLVIFSIFFLLLFAVVFWYFFSQKPSSETKQTNDKTATTSAQGAPVTPQSENSVDDEALIKEALVAKTGITQDLINVTISQKVDNFVKGSVGTKGEETGGGYFLAVKVNNAWTIVYDGQSQPNCSAVNPYSFPSSMASECLDNSGNLTTRQ